MNIKPLLHSLASSVIFCVCTTAGFSTAIDFETLPDSTAVNGFYAVQGVSFQNGISLTAGVSLNEIDFPPHSGSVVVGDDVLNDGDPMILSFANPVDSVTAFFAYASQLTFTAYGTGGGLLGTFSTSTSSHLGSTEEIFLPFSGIGTLNISGATANSFIMDDLSFSPRSSVPDGGTTIFLLSLAFLLLCALSNKKVGVRVRLYRSISRP